MTTRKTTKPRKRASKKLEKIIPKIIKPAEGVTIEELTPIFFDASTLKHQPEPIYRLDASNYRYYYRFDQNLEPIFYTSVTTLIKSTLPTSPYLINWKVEMGADKAEETMIERAHYGTFYHATCGKLLMTGKYELSSLPGELAEYCAKEQITPKAGWIEDLKKDVLCFAQFMIERKVKPLAIEIILYHPTDGYAGALDLVCELEWNKKTIPAIIDLKSGRKGFYESYEIQLEAYRRMWNIHFPDLQIENIFNFSPKDFRGVTPTYNLKDQTGSKNLAKLPSLVDLAKIEDSKRTNTVTVINGSIDLTKGLEGLITEYSYIDLIKKSRTV